MDKISNLERSISDLEHKISKQKHALEVMKAKLASLRNQESGKSSHSEENAVTPNGSSQVAAVSAGSNQLMNFCGKSLHSEENTVTPNGSSQVGTVSAGGNQLTNFFTEDGRPGARTEKISAIGFGQPVESTPEDNAAKSNGSVQRDSIATPSAEVINGLINRAIKYLARYRIPIVVQYIPEVSTGLKLKLRYRQEGTPVANVELRRDGWLYFKDAQIHPYLSLDKSSSKLSQFKGVSWDQWYCTVADVIASFMHSSNELFPGGSDSRRDGKGGDLRTTLNNQIKEEFI